jgi:hypothetical protein
MAGRIPGRQADHAAFETALVVIGSAVSDDPTPKIGLGPVAFLGDA